LEFPKSCTPQRLKITDMSQQGKALSQGQRQFITALKAYFDAEKKAGPTAATKDPTGRVAAGLNIGRRTVENVLAQYHKDGNLLVQHPHLSRGQPAFRLSDELVPSIREYIRVMNQNGQHVSVPHLRSWLLEAYQIEVSRTTLWESLKRMGFVYGKGKRRSALKERDYVILARRKYLRKKRDNRQSDGSLKRPEVYLDETFINQNISTDTTWYLESDGSWVNKPLGKGPRLIIVHAITKEGWVNGGQLVFQASRRTGDYHSQMNWDNFSTWFTEQLLPNIPSQSLIVMDNAPYHNVFLDENYPTSSSTKPQLRDYLTAHDYPWTRDMVKSELFELCRKHMPPPEYKIDAMAREQGHVILRTPQYHPELQPIETCWGIVKNHGRQHSDFTMKNLRQQLAVGFAKVTAETCKEIIETIYKQEEKFWQEDIEMDRLEDIEEN
jgi:transposase